jgi:hypothetical protein
MLKEADWITQQFGQEQEKYDYGKIQERLRKSGTIFHLELVPEIL